MFETNVLMDYEYYEPVYKWTGSIHRIRLLPTTVAGHPLGLTVWQHEGLPDSENVVCPKRTWPERGLHCHLCCLLGRQEPETRRQGVPYLEARSFTNMIDRRDVQKGVQIVELPALCYQWIIEATRCRVPYGNPLGDITDLSMGRDLVLKSPGSEGGGYDISVHKPTPLHDDPEVVTQWMNERVDVREVFPFLNEVELMTIEVRADWVRERLFGGKSSGTGPQNAKEGSSAV